jgi:AmmeMemoRadiSam system protein A
MSSPLHNSAAADASSSQAGESQPAGSQIPESQSPEFQARELSPEERRILLKLAHEAIESALENRRIPIDPPLAHLDEPRGVFTTIYLQGELRGCVGYVSAVTPLYRAVAETARAAAFDDTRFRPVTREEAMHLEVSLSILSPLCLIEPEQIEIGRHGLVVSMPGHRGLLLPQVPVEHQWDRVTFLEQTCRKAGLPADAWKMGATLEAFTAEVFGDGETAR